MPDCRILPKIADCRIAGSSNFSFDSLDFIKADIESIKTTQARAWEKITQIDLRLIKVEKKVEEIELRLISVEKDAKEIKEAVKTHAERIAHLEISPQ